MAFYQKVFKQYISSDVESVWDFISSPENLNKITPQRMGFEITSEIQEKMYPGMLITYLVNIFPIFKTNWVTEITQVEEKRFFIDEQRMGPYKIWHHQHHIKETKDGVLMTDIISYAPPAGFLGAIANKLFINKQIMQIFEYRTKKLKEIFPN